MKQDTILHPVVMVFWKDAVSEDPWTSAGEIEPRLSTIKTVGMLVSETEEVLTIGLNHDLDSDNWACFIHIPKSTIVGKVVPLL